MPLLSNPVYFTTFASPIGTLLLTSREGALTGLFIQKEAHSPSIDPGWEEDKLVFSSILDQVDNYFVGTQFRFDIPFKATGTDFQRKVWSALCDIPYGATWSYLDLATRIGNHKASRAVGLANGRNPISIIVPCHRVIGANGSLTGYGGGLAAKKWLLEHERKFLVT